MASPPTHSHGVAPADRDVTRGDSDDAMQAGRELKRSLEPMMIVGHYAAD